ncbi:DUF4383 domain-containing protein [Micromonospora fiedleri]|uniref:DUF4383 domain-containing protein n=2 Tax=Micromonospora TaxID=1873 RepID=A0ABS1UII0_9ACTN|nr:MULTISPECIES: DUF4383 domain-containing protein [Micromonospora]MBL6276044.1 DUF4383 domain-containing protein [Micromonospora fiedleri]PMR59440.1 DUF4383 domain-containing protein [Verrucosispora sp. ts21]WSK42137.1 DUF4383 domain-containing protein [Micromonospora maris]GIJ13336.1 membrane protein [Micromonospora gifhornensis]
MAHHARRGRPGRSRVQLAALAVAALFLVLGVAGFIPGITTGYGDMTFAGHHSGAKLLGLFQVSILHNLLHLGFGLIGLVLARRLAGARIFLTAGGAVYLALWLYGWATEDDSSANFIPVNGADDFLHLGLGFGMLALGLLLSNNVGTGGRLDDPLDRP